MRLVVMLLVVFVTSSWGCVRTNGTDLCEDAAAEQCSQWRECFCPDGSCDHRGVDLSDGACEAELADSCVAQASTLELPTEEVQTCVDALDDWTCEEIRSADVQGRPTSPPACTYYF